MPNPKSTLELEADSEASPGAITFQVSERARPAEQSIAAATMTAKGQIVIPARIRARQGLTPGTQVEFVDAPDGIRLVVRRKVAPTDPAASCGLIKVPPRCRGQTPRRLGGFDAAATLHRPARAER